MRMGVLSLGREDPLEKEVATHSSIPAWRIPWAEEPGRLHTVHGVAKSWTQQHTRKVKNKIFFLMAVVWNKAKTVVT